MVWSRFPLIVYCFSNPFQRKFSCASQNQKVVLYLPGHHPPTTISPTESHFSNSHPQFGLHSRFHALGSGKHYGLCCSHQHHRDIRSWDITRFKFFFVEMATLSFGLTHFGESRTKRKLPELQSCFHFHEVSHSVMVWEVREGDVQAVSKQCNVWNLNLRYRANDT